VTFGVQTVGSNRKTRDEQPNAALRFTKSPGAVSLRDLWLGKGLEPSRADTASAEVLMADHR